MNAKSPNNESYNIGFNDGYQEGKPQENIADYPDINIQEYWSGYFSGESEYIKSLKIQ